MVWYWCNLSVGGIPNRSSWGTLQTCASDPGLSKVDPTVEHMLGCAGIHLENLWLLVGFRGEAEVQRKMFMWRKAEANGGYNKEVQGRRVKVENHCADLVDLKIPDRKLHLLVSSDARDISHYSLSSSAL